MTDTELVEELRAMARAYRDLEAKHPDSGIVAAIGFTEKVATLLGFEKIKKEKNQ